MATPKQRTRFYRGIDFTTIDALELRIEKHEADLTSKLITLELAENETGEKGTVAIFEKVNGLKVGHLIVEEYTNDADANLKTTNHKLAGELPVLPGDEPKAKIKIGDTTKKVLVFRDRP